MGRGTGTPTLKVKLLQQVAALRDVVLHAILLDLHKAYNALGRTRCLYILEIYGLGPRDLNLLCRYWERLKMVAQTGGYYGEPFRGERGFTQGDPLFPTIFNVVVDAVVRHWEYLVAEREEGDRSNEKGDVAQTMGRTIQDLDNGRRRDEEGHQGLMAKSGLLHSENGMVAPTDPGWLQLSFEMLMGVFDRVGLWTNFCKTVGMV